MKKILVLLFTLCVVAAVAAPAAVAQETEAKKPTASAKKEARWHGRVVRINTDESFLDVRRENIEKRIHFSESTKWTRSKKAIEPSEVKEGSDVICLGDYEGNEFHATRIDLREK